MMKSGDFTYETPAGMAYLVHRYEMEQGIPIEVDGIYEYLAQPSIQLDLPPHWNNADRWRY